MENVYHSEVTTLISDEVDFKVKRNIREKEIHLIIKGQLIKKTIVLNMYALISELQNIWRRKLIKLKGEKDKHNYSWIFQYFSSTIDRKLW